MKKKAKSPKVLHVSTVPEFLFFLEKQLNYMKENGFDMHVLSSPGQEFREFVESENVIPYEVEMERDISVLRDIRSLWKIWRVMRKNKFDIVHVHTPKAGLLGMIAATIAGVRVRIYHIHGLPYMTHTGLKKKILYYCEKLCCHLSSEIYAVSPSLREFVSKEQIAREGKVRILANGSINGLDCEHRFNRNSYPVSKGANTHNITSDDFVIGFVGRLVKDKGIIELIEAFKQLKNRHEKVKLLLVGNMEAVETLPESLVKEIEQNPAIIYVGSVDNPAPYYALMDVLVLPTYREGFGLVAIEAMAMDVPVIASRVLGCMDTVEDGKNGFLVPAKDIHQIVDKVEYYINHDEERVQHGRYGRSLVKEKYEQTAIWKGMLQDYRTFIRKV